MTGFSKFSFLRRVRIHDGECGAVARALHHKAKLLVLPAAPGKVLRATQERKVMSNKTFFKRIAMTAVAALGFGMLSIAPTQATVQSNTLTIDSATDAINIGETATAVLTHNFIGDVTTDSVLVRAVLTSGSTSSIGALDFVVSDSSTNTGTTDPVYVAPTGSGDMDAADTLFIMQRAAGAAGAQGASAEGRDKELGETAALAAGMVLGIRHSTNPDSFVVGLNGTTNARTTAALYLTSAQAGTYVVTIFTTALNTSNTSAVSNVAGPSVTWTVTVTAPDTKPTTYTSVVRTYGGTAGDTASTDGTDLATDSTTVASTTSSSVAPKFTIWTHLNNQKGTDQADNATDSLTVTVSGEAYISAATANQSSGTGTTSRGTLKALTMDADAAPDAGGTPLYVWSTGTAGTATVTFTAINSGLTWSKTLTFHGDGSKIAIGTARYKIARAGGFTTGNTTTSPFFTVTLKDSGDRAVLNKSLTVTSSNTAVATGSCADTVGAVNDGTYACSVTTPAGSTSGQTATLTVTYEDAAEVEYSVTYNVTLGGGVASVVLTTDKANYEPGEKMVVTATAKDASGNAVYDGLTGPTLTANKALGATLTMNTYLGGVSTSQTRTSSTQAVTAADTLYAPAASGKFTISGLAGDAAGTPISVTATVTDDAATAAASAATDAALEAIDAANAATDAANLAAEAADAATVAAEEARDAADAATAAVEALATEVATLMAALKAQITTLANTVAKIAKKVKA